MKNPRWMALAAGLVTAAICAPSLARAGEEVKKGVAFEDGAPAFADVLAKAKTGSKPVFIDFFTAH